MRRGCNGLWWPLRAERHYFRTRWISALLDHDKMIMIQCNMHSISINAAKYSNFWSNSHKTFTKFMLPSPITFHILMVPLPILQLFFLNPPAPAPRHSHPTLRRLRWGVMEGIVGQAFKDKGDLNPNTKGYTKDRLNPGGFDRSWQI